MEIKGTIIAALPETSGVSKAGNQWKKKEYVLENTDSQYPRKVAFTCFGAAPAAGAVPPPPAMPAGGDEEFPF